MTNPRSSRDAAEQDALRRRRGRPSCALSALSGPRAEYRPVVADVVASVKQAGAAWDVKLRTGRHVLLTAAVDDIRRPGSGGPRSPTVGELLLTDSLARPSWVAISLGGGGDPGEERYEIPERATVTGGRMVFQSGLSFEIGEWRDGPTPAEGSRFASVYLDAAGRAVDDRLPFG